MRRPCAASILALVLTVPAAANRARIAPTRSSVRATTVVTGAAGTIRAAAQTVGSLAFPLTHGPGAPRTDAAPTLLDVAAPVAMPADGPASQPHEAAASPETARTEAAPPSAALPGEPIEAVKEEGIEIELAESAPGAADSMAASRRRAAAVAAQGRAALTADRTDSETEVGQARTRPRIAVLYANIGGGHKAAAKALEERARSAGVEADFDLIDVVEDRFVPPLARGGLMDGFYQALIRACPSCYDGWFRVNHMARAGGLLGPLKGAVDAQSESIRNPSPLLSYLRQTRPDAVFSTFSHATEDAAAWRARGLLPRETRIASALTDYVRLPLYYGLIAQATDKIFLPSLELLRQYRAAGQEMPNAEASGIPVDPAFSRRLSVEERRAQARALGLDPDKPVVFVISGRAGHADFARIVRGFMKSARSPVQVVVVAGENAAGLARVKAAVAAEPGNQVSVTALALVATEMVRRYLSVSDVVITKAGGLTATEVATARVPVVFIDNNGGQEADNIRFFTDAGAAISTRKQSDSATIALALVADPIRASAMRDAQARLLDGVDPDAPIRWLRTIGRLPSPEIPIGWRVRDVWLGLGSSRLLRGEEAAEVIAVGSGGTVFGHPTRANAVLKVLAPRLVRLDVEDDDAVLRADDERLRVLAQEGVSPWPLGRIRIDGRAASVRQRIIGTSVRDVIRRGEFSEAQRELVRKLAETLAAKGLLPLGLHAGNIFIGRREGDEADAAYIVDFRQLRDISMLPASERARLLNAQLAAALRESSWMGEF